PSPDQGSQGVLLVTPERAPVHPEHIASTRDLSAGRSDRRDEPREGIDRRHQNGSPGSTVSSLGSCVVTLPAPWLGVARSTSPSSLTSSASALPLLGCDDGDVRDDDSRSSSGRRYRTTPRLLPVRLGNSTWIPPRRNAGASRRSSPESRIASLGQVRS